MLLTENSDKNNRCLHRTFTGAVQALLLGFVAEKEWLDDRSVVLICLCHKTQFMRSVI